MKPRIFRSLLLMLVGFLLFLVSVAGQEYAFLEIKENLLKNRPITGDPQLRKQSIISIDDQIFNNYSAGNTKEFYTTMIQKAIQEIKHEKVDYGATVWQIYNHGWVVKTPTVTIGFDLYDFWNSQLFYELAELLDISFISHKHGDHSSKWLSEMLIGLKKHVVAPSEFQATWLNNAVRMEEGESKVIGGLDVTAHFGLHSVPVRQFEVTTGEGIKILHTGGNQTSETLPQIDSVNIMLLNGWINESGRTSHINGIRIAIDFIKPDLTLPGHILELGHIGGYMVPYADMFTVHEAELASDYEVLAWGERYHYGEGNDTVLPRDVTDISYHTREDTLIVEWTASDTASDGDTASFYRIIHAGNPDVITTNKKLQVIVNNLPETHHFKIYAFDDCGNQSKNYAEIQAIITDSGSPQEGIEFLIYPNPMCQSAALLLEDPQDVPFNLRIIDTSGKECRFIKNIDSMEFTIERGNLEKGIYFLELKSSRRRCTGRLIIQ